MTKLLKVQNEIFSGKFNDARYLRGFFVALLSHLLEIWESDLSAEESMDIDHFISSWLKGTEDE